MDQEFSFGMDERIEGYIKEDGEGEIERNVIDGFWNSSSLNIDRNF